MKDDAIKQLLQENLKSPEKENFNNRIMQQLQIKERKPRQILSSEKSVVHWFLFISGFVLFFYLQKESERDAIALLVGSVVSAMPLYLLLFNKIYSLKK